MKPPCTRLLVLVCAVLAPVLTQFPVARNANGGARQPSLLAPWLAATNLAGRSASGALPVRLFVDGKPLGFETLEALRRAIEKTTLTVEVAGTRVQAGYLGRGAYAAAYRFRYEDRDYVVKIPIVSDRTATRLNRNPLGIQTWPAVLDWMTDRGCLRLETSPSRTYHWTPRGRTLVVHDSGTFYAEIARILASGPPGARRVPLMQGKSLAEDEAVRLVRNLFQHSLPCCLSAWREVEGSALLHPIPLQVRIPLADDSAAGLLTPYAVVQQYQPAQLTLQDLQDQPERQRQRLASVVNSAISELERAHRLGRIHGDIKLSGNIAIDADGRARLIDWGSSHTPAQLRAGHEILGTQPFLSSLRYDRKPYNPFFDDYYGLAASLGQVWDSEPPEDDGGLPVHSLTLLHLRLPELPEAVRAWKNRGVKNDEHALVLAVLEICGAARLPGYLVWGNPGVLYESVEEIEREAATRLLGAAA